MKENKSKKKLLLGILIPVAAILIAGGLVVGLNAKNWFGPKETPVETEAPSETETEEQPVEDVKLPVAYNVDYEYYSGMTEGGLSSRKREEDGLYHIIVSIEGVQREVVTDKYPLVNVIDSREFSCIIVDDDNVVQEVRKLEDCGYTILLESGYMQKYDPEQGIIRANIDENMAGYAVTIPIKKEYPLYDTMNKEDPAPAVELAVGAHLAVLRYDPENQLQIIVFPETTPVIDRMYWNVDRKWSADIANTMRLPDENGDYVFRVYHNGEETIIKTKILELAKRIDSYAFKCFAARMNKDGYVVHVTRCQDALSSRSAASWHIVMKFEDEEKTTFTAKKFGGSDDGHVETVETDENTRIFNVGGPFEDHGGETTSVELGDQVHCILNAEGKAALVFVIQRRVESRVYWNVSRKYDSTAKETTRTPDANGFYVYTMAVDGKQITLKTPDKDIANQIDAIAAKHMGLTLDGDVITAVHTTAGNKVRGYFGSAASWYDIVSFTDGTKKEFTARKNSSGSDHGKEVTLKVSDDCVIYNVSSHYTSFVGEPTTLELDDRIHCLVNADGEASFIYVVSRNYKSDIYWNVTRKYNSTTKETTRTPDADGYYRFTMAVNGKQVEVQTKDKAIATKMDSYAARNMGLLFAGDGKTVVKVLASTNVSGYTGGSSSSWCDVLSISGKKFTTQKLTDTSSSYYMKVFNETKASNCKVYNVSGFYGSDPAGHFVGESTTLRVGDRVHVLLNANGEAAIIFVVNRAYAKVEHKDSHVCYDCGEEVEWTAWTSAGTLPTATGHYYLCGNVTLTGQSNIEAGANVVICLNGYKVTGADTARMFNGYGEGAKLTVIGEVSGSKIIAGKYQNPEGDIAGLVAYTRNADMAFYGVTVDASNVETPANASAFFLSKDHKLELHNVTIIGGKAGKIGGSLTVNSGSTVLLDNVTFKGGTSTYRNETVGVSGGTLILKGNIKFEGLPEGGVALYLNNSKVTFDGFTGGSITVKSSAAGKISTNYEEGAENAFTSADPAYVVGIGDGTALVLATGKATGVTLAESTFEIRKGQEKAIEATVVPEDAATTLLEYTSADETIATVDENGVVTASATKEGTTTITVRTKDGAASATVTVTVAGEAVAVTGITITNPNINLTAGCSEAIAYTITPPEAGYQKLTYVSSNEAVAKVDENGLVKGVGVGNATITVTPELGSASATVNVTVVAHEHCVCGDGTLTAGGHTHNTPEWIPWTESDKLPTGADADGKYYYLTSDVTVSSAQALTGVNVTLCLNGYTVTSTAPKTYNLKSGGTLNLTDCAGTGAMKVSGSHESGSVAGGLVSLAESTLNLYGGTLDASAFKTTYGGAIYADKSDTLNIYGGTVIGGEATNGGSIYLSTSSVLNMYGGVVRDGKSTTTGGNIFTSKACNFYGGTVSGGTATTYGGNMYMNKGTAELLGTTFENGSGRSGGNVYLTKDATLTIDGSTVTGGKATQSGSSGGIGGNICTNGVTTLKSGTISNGQNFGSQPGGNIGVWDTNSKFIMEGGLVTGGKSGGSTAAGGVAVFYHAAAGAFVMTGGTITGNEGGVYVKVADITVSGAAVIDGNTGSNLTAGGSAIKLGGALTTGAKIGVTVSAADYFAASETDYSAYFASDDTKYNVVWDATEKAHKLMKDNSSVKLDIYLLSGQSNATGNSTFESAKDGERDSNTYANVSYYTLRNYVDGSQGDYHPTYEPVKEGLGSSGNMIGPELGMARVLNPLYEGEETQALILKYAAGGTSLVRHKLDDGTLSPGATGTTQEIYEKRGTWYPTALESNQSKGEGEDRPTGFLYRGLLASIETVYNELLSMGYKAENITFKSFNWMQGESDRESSTVYKEVFPVFIAGVREKVSAVTGQDYSTLPVVVGEISESFGAATPERLAVCRTFIAMQNSLPSAVSNLTVIPTSTFELNGYDTGGNPVVLGSDESHWSYGDMLEIGRMFAEAATGTTTPTEPHTHCICGDGAWATSEHTHAAIDWKPWTYAYGLPTTAGNWYLTTDISIAATATYENAAGVNICLNGHNITADCNRPIYLKTASSLTITNCGAAALYKNVRTARLSNAGGLFSVNGGSTVNIYHLKMDASAVTIGYGPAFYINQPVDTVNLYDCEVTGGTAENRGGTIYAGGTLNLYDTKVTGGTTAASAGNISYSGATTNVIAGNSEVSGGTSTSTESNNGGGNIGLFATGVKLTIKDNAKISGGTAQEGGNIFALATSEVTITDNAVVENGTATTGGGNLAAAGSAPVITITGNAKIENGTAASGGNLYLRKASVTTLSENATVSGGIATGSGSSLGQGGNIALVKDSTATFNMTGGTVTNGVSKLTGGGNIAVYHGTTANLSGGTVSYGWANSNGYNIRVQGTLNISGNVIITGRGTYNGTTSKNNSVSTNEGTAPVINMTGGVITENIQCVKAGAVITISGGTVIGNAASNTGLVEIKGGYVGGTVSGNGSTGTVTVTGGTFVKNPSSFLATGYTAVSGTYSNTSYPADTLEYKYQVQAN